MSISNEFGTKLGYEKSRADKAESELDRAYERYDQAEKDRNHWHDKAQEYKQRCAEWQETYMELVEERDLPRVITADELRRGQKIAVFDHEESSIGVVASSSKYSIDFTNYGGWSVHPDEMPTIVLLVEAPDTKDIKDAKRLGVNEYPDNPWFATVYEDAKYWAGTWRGTPVRPQSINRGDLYDIHTAHGSAITGILAGRNGIHRPQSGDQYRLVNRAT